MLSNNETVKNPIVTIEMANGRIMKVELYPEIAPNTVNNFISLVKKGFYNGLIFHRVIPDFVIQAGCPNGNGMGGPGYSIKGEFNSNGFKNSLKHDKGVISMARAQAKDSGGSQFFLMAEKVSSLDGQYAAFGKIVEGLEIIEEIVSVKTDMNDRPMEPQVMANVTVETFDVNYPEPITGRER